MEEETKQQHIRPSWDEYFLKMVEFVGVIIF